MAKVLRILYEKLAKLTRLPADDYLTLTICKKLLFHIGLWPAANEPKGKIAFVRRFLPPFLLMMATYAFLIGYTTLVYTTIGHDLQRSLEAAAGVFVVFTLLEVYMSLLFGREKLDAMFEAMEEMNACSAKIAKRSSEVLDENSQLTLLPFGYMLLTMASVPLGLLDLPALYAKRRFAFDQWYPFEEKEAIIYQLVFILTTISHYCALLSMVSYSTVLMTLLVEAINHFHLLAYNLSHIVEDAKFLATQSLGSSTSTQEVDHQTLNVEIMPGIMPFSGVTQARTLSLDTKTVQGDKNVSPAVQPIVQVEEALKLCVQHHHSILRFIEELSGFYETFLFRYLLCTLIPTSIAVVLLIYAPELDANNMTVLILVFGSNLGMGAICWLANRMTEESEGIREAIYDSDWFGQSENFKRSVRIIMTFSNQPSAITVGGFVTLSLKTYYEMVQLTYSYSMTVWAQYEVVDTRRTEVVTEPGLT